MPIRTRSATKHGSKHQQWGVNNQDSLCNETFGIPPWHKNYHVGVISDGCTGKSGFSHTEVGANLMTIFVYSRVQEYICTGASMADIPRALFHSCTEFIRNLTNLVVPPTLCWPYPAAIKDRATWDAQQRFRGDYLSSTLVGFATDETDLVIFSAGDGVILVNDELTVIDQDDKPEYPANSVNKPGRGFETKNLLLADISRVVIASDGLKQLMSDAAFVDRMFSHKPDHPLGLQFLLNMTFDESPELMGDDCTVITLEKVSEEDLL